MSKSCPKNFDKRSSNKNNIKHKPWADHSHKNCGILSKKLYYNIIQNVNKISDPSPYRSWNCKGKQRNKIENKEKQKENHNFCLRILSNSLLSPQTDSFLDINCKKYSGRHIFTTLQNYHGDIRRRQKETELLELMRPTALKLNPACNKRMETFNWYQKQNQQLLLELQDVRSILKIVKELRENFKD